MRLAHSTSQNSHCLPKITPNSSRLHRVRRSILVAGVSDVFVAHFVHDIAHVGLQGADVVAFGIEHTSTRTAAVHVVELELHRVVIHVDREEEQIIIWNIGLEVLRVIPVDRFVKVSDVVINRNVLSTLHAHMLGVGAVAFGIEHAKIILDIRERCRT